MLTANRLGSFTPSGLPQDADNLLSATFFLFNQTTPSRVRNSLSLSGANQRVHHTPLGQEFPPIQITRTALSDLRLEQERRGHVGDRSVEGDL